MRFRLRKWEEIKPSPLAGKYIGDLIDVSRELGWSLHNQQGRDVDFACIQG